MKFGFVFPGQGSQSLDMMTAFSDRHAVRATFEEASEVLEQDLWQLVSEGPLEALNQTINTQVAMLCADVAIYRAWLETSQRAPGIFAGHSLGEYSALVASGALTFADALPLVRFRARSMQDAVAPGAGAMAAILGLADSDVVKLCAEAAQNDVLEAVNFNSPGQVVIAGNSAAVERGMALAKSAGAKRAILLPVSVPSHCALMRPAAERLAYYLDSVTIRTPSIPVIQNADVSCFTEPEAIKTALAKQLYRPVRWTESIQLMADEGVAVMAECGPGKVLTGLNKRIVPDVQHISLSNIDDLEKLKYLLN